MHHRLDHKLVEHIAHLDENYTYLHKIDLKIFLLNISTTKKQEPFIRNSFVRRRPCR